jgi:hypothetical protein
MVSTMGATGWQCHAQQPRAGDEPLCLAQIKPRLLGHWGTTPGLNFIYVHMNRLIRERGLDAMYVIGPGHGAPGASSQTLTSKALTASCIHTCHVMKPEWVDCSSSSRFQAAFQATSPRRRRAASTKEASSATPYRMHTGPCSTTRSCSCVA